MNELSFTRSVGISTEKKNKLHVLRRQQPLGQSKEKQVLSLVVNPPQFYSFINSNVKHILHLKSSTHARIDLSLNVVMKVLQEMK